MGGGLSTTQGDPTTYPRLGSLIGFATPEQTLAVAEHVITVQRDFGNRVSRQPRAPEIHTRPHGPGWLQGGTAEASRLQLGASASLPFDRNGDRFGWTETHDGLWHLCLYLRAGRVVDTDEARLLEGIRELAKIHDGEFRLTSNQNVIIANIKPENRERIQTLVTAYGLDSHMRARRFRLDALSCVALPTCPLAMAEAERYLPHLLDKIEALLERHGLRDAPILFRLSGCPNSCSRSYLGEIGLIGRALGRYDLRLGADDHGERLNALYRENIDETAILGALDTLFARYAAEREPGEPFGDFVRRKDLLKV